MNRRAGLGAVGFGVILVACGGGGGGGGTPDAGQTCTEIEGSCTEFTPPAVDPGTPPEEVTCTAPSGQTPGEGLCCYRDSQADNPEAPELKLRYIDVLAPVGSDLMSDLLVNTLNDALSRETFIWLFRVEGAEEDGPVEIVTGFGLKNEDGTYRFPTGAGGGFDLPEYRPVTLDGTITGETISSEAFDGTLTIPITTADGSDVQLELVVRDLRILEAQLGQERSCVGWAGARGIYTTAAQLDGFIEVQPAREGTVVAGPVTTTVCSVIAGAITNASYCDCDPTAWEIKPDSLCTSEGCTANTGCSEDVCDRAGDSDTLPACNAWRLVAAFAAHGVEIAD